MLLYYYSIDNMQNNWRSWTKLSHKFLMSETPVNAKTFDACSAFFVQSSHLVRLEKRVSFNIPGIFLVTVTSVLCQENVRRWVNVSTLVTTKQSPVSLLAAAQNVTQWPIDSGGIRLCCRPFSGRPCRSSP